MSFRAITLLIRTGIHRLYKDLNVSELIKIQGASTYHVKVHINLLSFEVLTAALGIT